MQISSGARTAVVLVVAVRTGACSPAPVRPVVVPSITPAPVSTAPSPEGARSPTPGPTAAPSSDAVVEACREHQTEVGSDETMPSVDDLEVIASTGGADGGAMLFAAPLPDDATWTFLGACAWRRTASGIGASVTGGTFPAAAEPGASMERSIVVRDAPTAHMVGGRRTPGVARVTIVLQDGSVVEAATSGGYWLAWWSGDVGSARVVGVDATGRILSDVPFEDTAP